MTWDNITTAIILTCLFGLFILFCIWFPSRNVRGMTWEIAGPGLGFLVVGLISLAANYAINASARRQLIEDQRVSKAAFAERYPNAVTERSAV